MGEGYENEGNKGNCRRLWYDCGMIVIEGWQECALYKNSNTRVSRIRKLENTYLRHSGSKAYEVTIHNGWLVWLAV